MSIRLSVPRLAGPATVLALALLIPASGDAAHRHHRHHRVVATKAASGHVLLVGTYKGIRGQYTSIQAAVDAANAGDWILVAPGDYKEQADHRANRGPQPAETPAGVVISKPYIHLRGMDRNGVVVDGTKPGSPQCSNAKADQDFGPTGSDGKPLGRNGILVWKADYTWVENLTVCNFLNGAGSAGNEIWWNGGDGGGVVGEHYYWGDYLTGTSNYFDTSNPGSAAAYAIFSSDAGPGWWDHTYGSNMDDSNYYVGACQNQCDLVMNHAWSEFGALGYSGTNSGGRILIENSVFDNNKDGFDTNSMNNSDWPSPQDGTCPSGVTSPVKDVPGANQNSCWVFTHNYVHDNNNPNVPGVGVASNGPTGTGMSISGGRNDTVYDNRFENNGAWGIVLVPYPDTETPPANTAAAGADCRGGIYTGAPAYACLYDDWADAILHNTFVHNGFFGNDTNSDFGEITTTAAATNCFNGNIDSAGVTSSPSGLEQSKPTCDGHTVAPDPNPSMTNQVACDTQFFASLLPSGSTPCTPGSNYPQSTGVVMHPLPAANLLESMPNPCAGVPANAWCANSATGGSHHRKHAAVRKHKKHKKHKTKHKKKHARRH